VLTRTKYALKGLVVTMILATGTGIGITFARGEKPPRNDKLAMGEPQVKELLSLVGQDNNGRVSEQAFLNYMKAEFERLDTKKEGVLDVRDLTRPGERPVTFSYAGK
jgi:hypothetical protein